MLKLGPLGNQFPPKYVVWRKNADDTVKNVLSRGAQKSEKYKTRNTLNCDQSNYSSRIVFSHIPINLVKPELAPFDPQTPKTPS